MSCTYPIRGWRAKNPSASGKRPIVFDPKKGNLDEEIEIPCGKCIHCRLEDSRVKAVRCTHEASCFDNNCFITLTYDNGNVPADGSLVKKHFQDFMKNVRYRLVPTNPYTPRSLPAAYFSESARELHRLRFDDWQYRNGIRYFMCGEYGQDQELLKQGIDKIGRPHYHALLFNYSPMDQATSALVENVGTEDEAFEKQKITNKYGLVGRVENSKTGEPQYLSSIIQESWNKGRTRVSSMSFESAAYVARYTTKKIDKGITLEQEQAFVEHYSKYDEESGSVYLVEPEYGDASRRPGIGRIWYDRYKQDLRKGYITVNGNKLPIPKYYLNLMENDIDLSADAANIRQQHKEFMARKNGSEYDSSRYRAKDHIKLKQLKQLKRD